jgi:predicted secreted protein
MEDTGVFTGLTGRIAIATPPATASYTDYLVQINSWSIDDTRTIITATPFGSKYAEKYPAIADWSASADGNANFLVAGGHAKLKKAYDDAALIEVAFFLDETHIYRGKGYIESFNVSFAADGLAEISISVAGNGPLVLEGVTA